jgi:hypothetical protein
VRHHDPTCIVEYDVTLIGEPVQPGFDSHDRCAEHPCELGSVGRASRRGERTVHGETQILVVT